MMCPPAEKLFLSTLSLRRATILIHATSRASPFLSTLSLRRATFCLGTRVSGIVYFYPRSPCGERRSKKSDHLLPTNISIHALLAESDNVCRDFGASRPKFLSTLSLRRATILKVYGYGDNKISIHALLAESDPEEQKPLTIRQDFYPRSPCGERP